MHIMSERGLRCHFSLTTRSFSHDLYKNGAIVSRPLVSSQLASCVYLVIRATTNYAEVIP